MLALLTVNIQRFLSPTSLLLTDQHSLVPCQEGETKERERKGGEEGAVEEEKEGKKKKRKKEKQPQGAPGGPKTF